MEERFNTWKALRLGDEQAIEGFYRRYRDGLVQHIQTTYQFPFDQALDLAQDAIIVLLEKLHRKDHTAIQAQPVSYLYGIARYLVFARFRKQGVEQATDPTFLPVVSWEDAGSQQEEQYQQIQQAWQQLGKVCQDLLFSFYYQGKRLDELMQEGRYQHKDVLKSQKARCLKHLKDIVHGRSSR